MNRLLGLVCAGFLSLGVLSLACSSGEVVQGPLEGQAGSTGAAGSNPTGVAGSHATGVAGSNPTGVAGSNPTGVAGSPGRGGSTGVAGSPGRGGSTGVAGSPGRGGSTGVAGSSSTGVAGSSSTGVAGSGSGATTCAMGLSTPPQTALITDFSDAAADASNAGEFKFGTATASAQGGTSRFSSGTKGTLSLAAGALKYSGMTDAPSTANMYPYSGFTVYINGPACVDAHTYTGVQFTIKDLTGTCDPVFGFGDSDHTAAGDNPMRGTGPAGSYGASFALTASTTKVPFAMTPASVGSPATPVVNAAKLTGVQFQFKQKVTTATAACTGGITVDDISFY